MSRGPAVESTWQRVERTVVATRRHLGRGLVPVTGVGAARPLLEQMDVPEAERDGHFSYVKPKAKAPEEYKERLCVYCNHDAVCGKRWEGLR
jgi:hypothetical protein